ncbi:glycosyl hydrolase [Marinihelvus fidelis]|uniref:Glycosyl hydrolase n=1 Tax=Marinihelvus fidelis TaxID=2613842 RepID=A0A5N0T6L5_9GAMM|nr:glycoside hydrolase family 127 protein [Marinihelvus fidelis]KAA9130512.1 glycosyl hydrolase [Marinihelvus fidelis]
MRGLLLGLLCPFTLTPSLLLADVSYFLLDQVRLLDGPFKAAQDRNIDYLLALEPDRLLAPYLREAGLEPKAPTYGNWEGSGLDGHIGGHYVSALALAVAATGRDDMRQRLDYMLTELKRAQDANGDGYIGGVPESNRLWGEIRRGDINADLFSLNGGWVPWYNIHKTFAGLRDAYLYTDSPLAREMLIDWADWAAALVEELSDEQVQAMLRSEHGGPNEVFADVYAITGDEKYLALARRFSHRLILDPLLAEEDQLTGLHANTQIPKVIGYQRVAEVANDDDWHDAATFFWDTVVNGRSIAIGGNSVREHFNPRDDFSSMIEDIEGPETCNTYNMLRLTRQLFGAEPQMRYADYYERALYNHILGSQDPQTGGLVYFTPMRPQHYRVYSQPDQAMWCCVGSGIENHVKYGEFIYAHDDDGNEHKLLVNLFIPSRLEWPEQGVVIRQETRFPDESATRLVFETDAAITLALRYPTWATATQRELQVNGEPVTVYAAPGEYIDLKRTWKAGDTVTLALPMKAHLEPLPDGSPWNAVLYGPIVLSAPVDPFEDETLDFLADDSRMGHIAAGAQCPLEESPMLVTGAGGLPEALQRLPGDELRFQAPGAIEPKEYAGLELIPFFRVHRTRYMVYWPSGTPSELQAMMTRNAYAEAARLALLDATIDSVNPGEQQPEAEHDLEGEGMDAGVNFNRHWRHATGWFGYRLADPENEARWLRITYWGADAGRSFSILLNGEKVAAVTLKGEHGAVFHDVDYPIPDTARAAADGEYTLRFEAAKGSIAGGIYGVRLLSSIPD